MNNKKRRFTVAKFLFMLFSLFILFWITIRYNKVAGSDTPEFRVLSLSAYYHQALMIASEWEADAYLASASPTFAMPQDSTSLSINYSFRSYSSPGKWLNVFFIESSSSLPGVSEGEFSEGNNRPLPYEIKVDRLTIDSAEALLIAYEKGGKDFILEHHGIDPDSFLQLEQENIALATGRPVWQVTFSVDRLSMHVILDATTGEVLELRRNDK